MIRGGSWMGPSDMSMVTSRDSGDPRSGFRDNGFRLVLPIELPKDGQ